MREKDCVCMGVYGISKGDQGPHMSLWKEGMVRGKVGACGDRMQVDLKVPHIIWPQRQRKDPRAKAFRCHPDAGEGRKQFCSQRSLQKEPTAP